MSRHTALSEKEFEKLDLEDVIYIHLNSTARIECEDMILESCLHGAEDEMRQSRGLEITSKYAPLLCGFAILDQLGSCYHDASKPLPPPEKSGVLKALQTFGKYPIGSAESTALYALRNSLVHDSSLAGRNKQGRWFFFRYNRTQSEAVRPAPVAWDGTHANLKADRVTWVNPRQITEEVSDIYSNVRNLYKDRRSDLVISLGRDEILNKFVFWTPKSAIPSSI